MKPSRLKGKLTTWNNERGFGFIQPSLGGAKVFVHIKGFCNRKRRPVVGQFVTYSLSTDERGQVCAVRATLPGDELTKKSTKPMRAQGVSFMMVLLVVIFSLALMVSVFLGKLPFPVLLVYFALSLITFLMYALDKSAAQRGKWRTQESTLQLLALCGGWPGALLGQQLFRHKTKKQSFKITFWIMVAINIAVLVCLYTGKGVAFFLAI